MARVERTTRVATPASEVWAVLADFAAISTWAPNVEHSCLLTAQTAGVGAVRRVQTGRAALRETVTVWEPERELSYSIAGLPSIIKSVTNTWQLSPAGDGTDDGTELSLVSEIAVGPRPPHRVAGHIVGRMLGSASDVMLEGLTQHLEPVGSRS